MEPTEAEAGGVAQLGDRDLAAVVDSNGVALVEFYAEWCHSCKRMEAVLEQIARDSDAAVLTADIESHLESAIEFGAQSAPTFVLFVDGRPVKQLRGSQSESALRDLLETYGSRTAQ